MVLFKLLFDVDGEEEEGEEEVVLIVNDEVLVLVL